MSQLLLIRIRSAVAILQIISVACLVTAIVAEHTTEEDFSKEIVIPTLYIALLSGGASFTMLGMYQHQKEPKPDPLL